MNDEPLLRRESLAYHEAGHAVMAIEKQIEVYELAIPSSKRRQKSRFAMLGDLHDLRSGTWHDLCRVGDRYVLFRLAGPAAEWTRLQRHHALDPGSEPQLRYRERFRRERIFHSQVDFDASYAFLTAWMLVDNAAEVNRLLERYWLRACEAWSFALMWGKVDQIAKALMASNRLSGAEVRAIYGESANSH